MYNFIKPYENDICSHLFKYGVQYYTIAHTYEYSVVKIYIVQFKYNNINTYIIKYTSLLSESF